MTDRERERERDLLSLIAETHVGGSSQEWFRFGIEALLGNSQEYVRVCLSKFWPLMF